MSIAINTNMYLLCSLFNISYKKIANEYSGLTIEEIMEAEAAQGNIAAANFDKEVLSNPVKLIELFQLKDPGNKYAILSNMNEHDLEDLLPLLEQGDLVEGLNFFNKDKLLELAEKLPKEELIKFTFQMFTPEHLMQLMPEEQLDKILTSTDMDKNLELKYLQTINPEILAQMFEAATGQPFIGSEDAGLDGQTSLNAEALVSQISNLPDNKFQEAMLSIPPQSKRDFVLKLTKENPKLYLSIDSEAYTNIIGSRKEKNEIVRSASVISPKQLVKMITKLPKDLTAIVLTQIDTSKFADVLLDKFKNILSQIIAA